MPTQLITCPQKQVIRKYIRNVPCSQKNGRRVTCPEVKKLTRQEISTSKRSQVKYPQVSACVSKQLSKCMPKTCPERERKIATIGCPKCESNRIQKLECEVYQLRKEIEYMKNERKEAEKAIQKAILRSACAIGGFKPIIQGSIEKLLDVCNRTGSSQSMSSVTFCASKSPTLHTCTNKSSRRRDINYCENY
ncbi:uncharacterized protein LOC102678939 [Apis dorsata]|uniref:uncharacterized protein LOC102678939 n=1 Tax=Apis dorsata TaxID=7462 RepID=UPI0003DF7EC5|nr:uncharacterized protein LOC102678939 [Apis dorsata]